jgi:hypothetical protein
MERANWRNTLPPQHPDKPSEAAKIGEVAEYGLLRSPINAALNPLSESPVSLALDRRTYGSENLSPCRKNALQQNRPRTDFALRLVGCIVISLDIG